jgi:hypothetical protein
MTELVDELLREALSQRHYIPAFVREAPPEKSQPKPNRRNQHAQSLHQLQQESPRG